MSRILCEEEFERFKEDYEAVQAFGVQYIDTWDFEDSYSHNDIEIARDMFIEKVNKYLESKAAPYYMSYVCENAMLFNKETDEIVR